MPRTPLFFAVPKLASLFAACGGGSPASSDSGTDTDTDADTDTGSDTGTDTGTDTDSETWTATEADTCDDPEPPELICAGATTADECAGANDVLTAGIQLCAFQYGGISCEWLALVETHFDPYDACAFGATATQCTAVETDGAAVDGGPPCEEGAIEVAFTQAQEGLVYAGWSNGTPDFYQLEPCDPLASDAGVCGCICDPDFPIQSR
jgi:hypothetical protein